MFSLPGTVILGHVLDSKASKSTMSRSPSPIRLTLNPLRMAEFSPRESR
jgi:hypothetical protein